MQNQQKWITIIFLSLLVIFNIWMIGFGKQPWIISSLNIFFHEAGHWIFSFFGQFISVLGGTLGEIVMPLIFIFYFNLHKQIPGEVFGWWWLTTALYDISIYMADARAQALSLIGGPGGHDWFYILGHTRLLDYDILLSRFIVIIALSITVYMMVLIYKYWELTRGKIIS